MIPLYHFYVDDVKLKSKILFFFGFHHFNNFSAFLTEVFFSFLLFYYI